jgi:hypothetical protein
MLEDVKLVQLMFDSIGQVPTEEEREAWQRIKKAALESCQQSGEAPVQHTQLAIPARSVVNHWDEFGPESGFDETLECLRRALKMQAGA